MYNYKTTRVFLLSTTVTVFDHITNPNLITICPSTNENHCLILPMNINVSFPTINFNVSFPWLMQFYQPATEKKKKVLILKIVPNF